MSIAQLALSHGMEIGIMAPMFAGIAAFVLPRLGPSLGLLGATLAVVASVSVSVAVIARGPQLATVGGWAAPLGIELGADGLSAAIAAMTATVGLLVSFQAAFFGRQIGGPRRMRTFWPIWMLQLSGMQALYYSRDVFNLYVTLEIVGLSAVALTLLGGKPAALRAALNYLFAGLFGSLLFLLGVDYLYAGFGRMDIGGLAGEAQRSAAGSAALSLIIAGLALKAAIFPLHFWLPAAHANAIPVASAILSALVVKTALYVMMRLWFDALAPIASIALPFLLGMLGACGVLVGSIQALRTKRLKLLVAYSTVAQIGYISLVFVIANGAGAAAAWSGAVMLMVSHGFAKAAMFLAVGRIAEAAGHDRIAALKPEDCGSGLTKFAYAMAAVSLIGLPPTGGFLGKWMMVEGAIAGGSWLVVGVLLLGTLLSAAYLYRPLEAFMRGRNASIDRTRGEAADLVPLTLAAASVALGLTAATPLNLLSIGLPFAASRAWP